MKGPKDSSDGKMIIIKGAKKMKKETVTAIADALKFAEKHVLQEGSRQHVVGYDRKGPQCSCENCEINKSR
jgi:hypothetical protein